MTSGNEKAVGICCGLLLIFSLLFLISSTWGSIRPVLSGSGIFYWLCILAIFGIISYEIYHVIDKPVKISGTSICLSTFGAILLTILFLSAIAISEGSSKSPLFSGDEDDLVLKGETLYNRGDYSGALSAFEQSLALDSTRSDTWNWKGKTLLQLAKYPEALEAFNKALGIDPRNMYAWNGKGVAFEHLTRYQEALDAYDTALAIDQNYAIAWNNKGVVLQKLGRNTDALDAYQKAISADPTNQIAKTNKKNLEAWISSQNG